MTVIEVKPHPWGWKVFEMPGVEPVFTDQGSAIGYATQRGGFSAIEVRVMDATGNVTQTIPADGTGRRL